jgi:hypothetical protein
MSHSCPHCGHDFKKRKCNLTRHLKSSKCSSIVKMIEKKKNDVTNNDYNNITFNQEQLDFINEVLCDCKLIGIPGGGKTRCIIEKINQAFIKKYFVDKSNFVILTFSKKTIEDIIIKGRKTNNNFTNKNVKTLHSLAGTIISKLLKRSTNSIETIIVSAVNVLKRVTREELKKIPVLEKLKVLFIDEAQDISGIQYEFLMLLKEKVGCFMIMIGDPNQNIYQFQDGSDKYLLNYVGKSFYLKTNYRSTKNIVAFTNHLRPNDNKHLMISGKNTNENEKIVLFSGSIDAIEKDIIKEIINCKYKPEEIAIVGPVKKSKPNYDTYFNIGLSIVTNLLDKKNIKFVKHYKDTQNEGKEGKTEVKEGHINIITIHGAKGLEYKKVLLLNFHFTTYGRRPTLKDYNNFQYLWYVAASRAECELKIYVDKSKKIWPALKDIPNDLYTVKFDDNKEVKLNLLTNLPFEDEIEPIHHGITKLLEDLKPQQQYELEELITYDFKETILFDTKDVDIVAHDEFSALYGQYIEVMFTYYYDINYHYTNNQLEDKSRNLFYKLKYKIENTVVIKKVNHYACKKIINRLQYKLDKCFTLNDFKQYKPYYDGVEMVFYNYLLKELKFEYDRPFYIGFENNIFEYAKDELIPICDIMIKNYKDENYRSYIFKMTLYNYQIENECGYLWNKDFAQHINSLGPILDNIKLFSKNDECCNLYFQKETTHPNLPLSGIIDILKIKEDNKTEIIDIKFTKQFTNKQVYQLLLYYNNLFPNWNMNKKLTIWNFYKGKKYEINIANNGLTNYDILKFICKITRKKMINTLFLYDLETTGLDIYGCEITERYFEEYNLGFSPSKGLLKIKNTIPSDVVNLTHITDKMCEGGDCLDLFKTELCELYNICDNPKFMAHNGSRFDHLILFNNNIFDKAYIKKDQLLDSRYIIRMLHTEDTLKMKLEAIYELIIGNKPHIQSHRADADVKMMIDILKKLEYKTIIKLN